MTRSPSFDGFVDRLSGFGFLPPDYPSYRVLTFTLVGLLPTEYASLRWTHLHAGLSRRTNIAISLIDHRSKRVTAWLRKPFALSLSVTRHPNLVLLHLNCAHFGLQCQGCLTPTSKSVPNLQALRLWKATAPILPLCCTFATSAFAQTFTVLYSFTGGADGANPSEGLVLDSAGSLYGTTYDGGTGNSIKIVSKGVERRSK